MRIELTSPVLETGTLPLSYGHIGIVEPTRQSGQTVFGTVAAANRLTTQNLATHCTISMQRSPGATRHSLQPKPPRRLAPVLCQILELHCDCGAGENRTPIAKGSGVTDRAHSTCSTPWKPSQTPTPSEEGALLSRRQPTRSGESAHDAVRRFCTTPVHGRSNPNRQSRP